MSEELKTNAGEEVNRMLMARSLGMTFDGERDLYSACGYKAVLTFTDYFLKYDRNGLAATVVEAFPDACWRNPPEVFEVQDEGQNTEFEKQWRLLWNDEQLFISEVLHRADVLSGIGRYSIILLGVDDGLALDQPLRTATTLHYLQVYPEGSAAIDRWETDVNSPRYGLPVTYKITLEEVGVISESTRSVMVHHSRVIHVPSDRVTGRAVYGTPRLKRVFNQLDDIEKILGSGAEGWWRSAFQGLQFDVRDNAEMTPASEKAMNEEIKAYIHNLQRYIRSKGVDIKPIAATVADPRGIIDVLVEFVSISTRVPKRILTGSEQGELAGSKDQENWDSRVIERRRRQSEAKILRPFVNTLVKLTILPEPTKAEYGKFLVDWNDESQMTALDRATIGKLKIETAAAYIQGNVEMVYPIEQFLGEVMDMDADQIKEVMKQAEEQKAEQEAEAAIEEEAAAEAAAAQADEEGNPVVEEEVES